MADIAYYLSLPYTTVLKRDDEGDIVATIDELDGCIAHGSDTTEALHNLREVQAMWLEAALTDGQEPPVPQIEDDLPSGKFVVRLPRSLHRKLNKLPKKDDVSLNQLMVMAATEHVVRCTCGNRIAQRVGALRAARKWRGALSIWTNYRADPPPWDDLL
jgi:antitoxin HicB